MQQHTTNPINSAIINVMVNAVRKATQRLPRDFNEVDNLQISRKGAVNFVTEADLRTEKILFEELSKARPKYGFLMEESGEVKGEDAEYRWVIDPLDGTSNFVHAIPYFATSVAVEKISENGAEIIAGVIYDIIHDEMFIAEKGKGAFVNNRRLLVSKRTRDYYFVTGTAKFKSPYSPRCSDLAREADQMEAVIRRSGSAALDLAYVAAGRYDAAWYPHLQKWDMAAGILLVKEAGGVISMLGQEGDAYESGAILAASETAHKVLVAALGSKGKVA
ncbi:MAG: inositol monophosphatase family protein [Rickettsiales bacterium]